MAKTGLSEAEELRMRAKRVIERNDKWAESPEGRQYGLRLEFANNLAMAMKAKKITQANLCAIIGMKQPQLSKIMAGDENVTLAMVGRLAEGLGIHPSRLFQKPRKAPALVGAE